MENHLLIFLKDGHVQSVISNFRADFKCLLVSASGHGEAQIQGEPWVHAVAFPEAAAVKAVGEPIGVEFNPDGVNRILAMEDQSRDELLGLLDSTASAGERPASVVTTPQDDKTT